MIHYIPVISVGINADISRFGVIRTANKGSGNN